MPTYLADTMAIVGHFVRGRLGQQAARLFREADNDQHLILLSAVTLMEVLYLSEGRRIQISPSELLSRIQGSSNYGILPMDADTVVVASAIDDVRELHDRMIAATAKHHQLPIITNDPVLRKSKHVTAVWQASTLGIPSRPALPRLAISAGPRGQGP